MKIIGLLTDSKESNPLTLTEISFGHADISS